MKEKKKYKFCQDSETETGGYAEYFEPTRYEWEQNGFKVVAQREKKWREK